MEIKREWILDRAAAMLKEIDEEIDRTERNIARAKEHAQAEEQEHSEHLKQLETELNADPSYNDADIRDIMIETSDAHSWRMQGDYYSRIEGEELRLTALKQDREIYKYYLEHNEKKEG